MKTEDFPKDIQPYLIPKINGDPVYRCLGCNHEFSIEKLLYTCPDCGQVLLIEDKNFGRMREISPKTWHRIFDYRKMVSIPALKGIYRYHEFIGPAVPLDAVVYLGEGHTPIIEANPVLRDKVGIRFFYKNEGQNPSASFKDRGMASALSYIHYLLQKGSLSDVLAVCASTGDTSASAALYAAYLKPAVKSAVLLPHKKVTPQQLSQPLGSGAAVFEIPGVFDDCMKIVESLSENYNVALLNSKNAWRILGQESYSYEIAQDFEYQVGDLAIIVPIGNAGNLSAVMSGFLKFYAAGIIDSLPKIIGVQSDHADPVFRHYQLPDPNSRQFTPVAVKPSVAQAAMIGNPVSMPRIMYLADRYNQTSKKTNVFFVRVNEQSIMDWQLIANQNGHIACTHGGESLAGLVEAVRLNIVDPGDTAVLDSTAHAIKFSGFQDMYFENRFPEEYEVKPKPELINAPMYIHPKDLKNVPLPGNPLAPDDMKTFVQRVSDEIAACLKLTRQTR